MKNLLKRILKLTLFLAVLGFLTGSAALVTAYYYVAKDLPKVETLSDYRPPIVTKIFSRDGALIAEYSKERRIVVPVEQMPKQLLQAFVAAEDASFFEHKGIDPVSIVRAAIKNMQAGRIVQGGSTITQQVAKSFFFSSEKKFSRKFKEAILAWRMEQHLTKEEILNLYLNQIYLGHAAYGVQAAAENYFDKDVNELTLGECAILAGLPQAPSRYSPYRNFDRAKRRQQYVLGQMVEKGYVSAEEAAAAEAEELVIHARENTYVKGSGYFTEEVRRYLEQTYGEEILYTQGLQVYTTMDLAMQQAAQKAVADNLIDHDHRLGYRGPLRVLPDAAGVAAYLAEPREESPEEGRTVEAVLFGEDEGNLWFGLPGYNAVVPKESFAWGGELEIAPYGSEATSTANDPDTKERRVALPLGSVVQLKLTGAMPGNSPYRFLAEIFQEPQAEGALIAIEPQDGSVRVMVGGYDFGRSQFNRVMQAKRLPGSAIKPIIYAAALDKGFTPATIIMDSPIIYQEVDDVGAMNKWKPKNYSEKWYGPTSLRLALTHSRNVVTIKVLQEIGINYAVNYAHKLGIISDLPKDLTLSLGSAAVTPMEIASAYGVFANRGVRTTPTYITKIVDRDGRVLESTDPADFPQGIGEGQRLIRQYPARVISEETAYLITNLMESVVRHGTGWRAKSLKRPSAGKTGTTNDLKDAWYAGYIPQLVAVAWVGYDQERPLGENETGSKAAAPAWVSFMKEAINQYEPMEFPVPDGIEFRPVDTETGLLREWNDPAALIEAFASGTAPTELLAEQQSQQLDFYQTDF